MSTPANKLSIEVVYATPAEQTLLRLEVNAGATVADAVQQSGLPADGKDTLAYGIWGRPVDATQVLSAGDRVELYRPLQIEPREARRALAELGRTMKQGLSE